MFKRLQTYFILIALPFVLLLVGSSLFFEAIKTTITRNPHPQINYTIFFIILVGGFFILLNARRLLREAKTLVEFSGAIHSNTDLPTLQKMTNGYTGDIACLLQMVASSGERSITHQEQAALEHELANTRSRLNRRNALPQYLTGLLVGMGLLGTFIGLLATLNDISVLISSFADLDMKSASPLLVFRTMIERMKAPMQSMGIAFSASMFGLLGSIILGLMMVGIRRLQGDIYSLLSSEIARHIEIALSYESITYRSGVEFTGDISDVAKVLIRIEERMAEAGRLQHRMLSATVEDFQKQRAEMLRTLTEQTESSNNFRTELQQLGRQLGSLVSNIEKTNSSITSQVSDLTVQITGGAKETHKLLALQIDEQKKLRDTLDSYNIEERLAEGARLQQRTLSAVVDDFQNQREEMLRTLAEQTESNNNFRSELQQLSSQFESFSNMMEKGNNEVCSQISELTVHMAADAKQSQILIGTSSNNLRTELQQMGEQLGTITERIEKGNNGISSHISQMGTMQAGDSEKTREVLEALNSDLRNELQGIASQLGSVSETVKEGDDALASHLAGLMTQMTTDSKENRNLVNTVRNEFRSEIHQFGKQIGSISNLMEKGNEDICTQISALMGRLSETTKGSHELFDNVSTNFFSELQQIGTVMEKGNDEICTHIATLITHMAASSKETDDSLAEQPNDAEQGNEVTGTQEG